MLTERRVKGCAQVRAGSKAPGERGRRAGKVDSSTAGGPRTRRSVAPFRPTLAPAIWTSVGAMQRDAAQAERRYLEMIQQLQGWAGHRGVSGSEPIRISSFLLARCLGVDNVAAGMIAAAVSLRDIGNLGVPPEILRHPGPLSSREWRLVQRHTLVGATLLGGSDSPMIQMASLLALTHHERWDGTGYPRGLQGEEIPLAARIVALVDQYDALRSARPHRMLRTHLQACKILLNGDDKTSPGHFDQEVLKGFARIHQEIESVYDPPSAQSPAKIEKVMESG